MMDYQDLKDKAEFLDFILMRLNDDLMDKIKCEFEEYTSD